MLTAMNAIHRTPPVAPMRKAPTVYTDEQKQEAITLRETMQASEITKLLGISASTLSKWFVGLGLGNDRVLSASARIASLTNDLKIEFMTRKQIMSKYDTKIGTVNGDLIAIAKSNKMIESRIGAVKLYKVEC